jgi:hypothetical protein
MRLLGFILILIFGLGVFQAERGQLIVNVRPSARPLIDRRDTPDLTVTKENGPDGPPGAVFFLGAARCPRDRRTHSKHSRTVWCEHPAGLAGRASVRA